MMDIKRWSDKTLVEGMTLARDRKSLRELMCRYVVSDLQQWSSLGENDDDKLLCLFIL